MPLLPLAPFLPTRPSATYQQRHLPFNFNKLALPLRSIYQHNLQMGTHSYAYTHPNKFCWTNATTPRVSSIVHLQFFLITAFHRRNAIRLASQISSCSFPIRVSTLQFPNFCWTVSNVHERPQCFGFALFLFVAPNM